MLDRTDRLGGLIETFKVVRPSSRPALLCPLLSARIWTNDQLGSTGNVYVSSSYLTDEREADK
jgi:hypothetical protein